MQLSAWTCWTETWQIASSTALCLPRTVQDTSSSSIPPILRTFTQNPLLPSIFTIPRIGISSLAPWWMKPLVSDIQPASLWVVCCHSYHAGSSRAPFMCCWCWKNRCTFHDWWFTDLSDHLFSFTWTRLLIWFFSGVQLTALNVLSTPKWSLWWLQFSCDTWVEWMLLMSLVGFILFIYPRFVRLSCHSLFFFLSLPGFLLSFNYPTLRFWPFFISFFSYTRI